MMMTRLRLMFLPVLLCAVVLALLPASVTVAQSPPPRNIDVSKLAHSEQDVVIPVPSEIFNALDKLGNNLNWASEVAPVSKKRAKKPEEFAMLLGTVIANGFVAVEAKDATRVQDIGHRVIELAGALNVQKAVLTHCNAIIDASKNGDWAGVRAELDRTQSSVRQVLEGQKSHDESELVSITGWLRGTQALSSLVNKDYKPDRAELLHQPDMLNTFDSQFKGMKESVQNNPEVRDLREGLQKIKPLIILGPDGQISAKSVEQINQITSSLVKTIDP